MVEPDSICAQYDYLTNPTYGFFSADLRDSVYAYTDSIDYDDAEFFQKYSLDINGETDYLWRVIATNYIELPGSDSIRVIDSNDKSFYIDITTPTSDFYLMLNKLYSEHFDMYIILKSPNMKI